MNICDWCQERGYTCNVVLDVYECAGEECASCDYMRPDMEDPAEG